MKSKTLASILALFFGGFGAHKFYLREYGSGIIHFIFLWTLIPTILGIINGISLLSMEQSEFDERYNDGANSVKLKSGYDRLSKKKEEQARELYEGKKYKEFIEIMNGKELSSWYLCCALAHSNFEVWNVELGRKLFNKAFTIPEGNKNDTIKIYGQCEYKDKNYKLAIKLLQEIDVDYIKDEFKYGDSFDIPKTIGLAFMALNKYELAIESFKRAPISRKDLYGDLIDINIYVGECYEKLNKPKMAIKHFIKANSAKYDQELDEKIESLQK